MKTSVTIILGAALAITMCSRVAAAGNAASDAATTPRLVEGYGRLPLSFEANRGQTDGEVNFIARGRGYTLYLTPTEAVLALGRDEGGRTKSAVVRMKLVGANPHPQVAAADRLPGKVNYFMGNDPKNWRMDVPLYARAEYRGVYRGVDLIYHGNQRQLEYDFAVAPGADPRVIRFTLDGVDKMRVDSSGDLVLQAGGDQIRFHKPIAYQQINGTRHEVPSQYALRGKNQLGFCVGAYDRQQPLIIDPVLVYSTYLGGTAAEQGRGIAVDSSGYVYVTGYTSSGEFPTLNPIQGHIPGGVDSGQDAYVTKFDPTGTALVYSTYIGGSNLDQGTAIAIDASGNAYVGGFTDSSDFPMVNPLPSANCHYRIGFVLKLNAAGSALVYSTCLGGSCLQSVSSIAVDSSGNAFVTGGTCSGDFPTANAFQSIKAVGGLGYDAFVTKINPAGSALVYSTYLGGNSDDGGRGIAVDASGDAYVTGEAGSPGFPTTAGSFQTNHSGGFYDAFVAKLNAAGSALLYSTFLGGNGNNEGKGITVDSLGNAYVVGLTGSTDFPIASSIQAVHAGGEDAFVVKLNAAGSALVYSTYLGGNGNDQGYGIAVDSSGNAYVTGLTESTDFPTANDVQSVLAGGRDTFVAKLDSIGMNLVYSTYIGGTGDDFALAIAVDSAGNAYLTGLTHSSNFPTACAFQSTYGGGPSDAFVSKIAAESNPCLCDTTPPVISCPGNVTTVCSFSLTTTVNYEMPTAADACDTNPTVTCSPASGSNFPIGKTTVNCTARDASGNQTTCSFTVTRAALGFTGFLSPIGGEVALGTGGTFNDPVRAFKLGSTIPVKFTALCNGGPVTTGVHTLQAIKYSSATSSDPPIDATPTDAATTGSQFRLTDATAGDWHLNMSTKMGFSEGTWLLRATLSDGSKHEVWITIKK